VVPWELVKQKECQALKLATKSPGVSPSDRAVDCPARNHPLLLASFRQKPYHLCRLQTRYGSRRARAHVQRRDPMALNRKICKNLPHHSYGGGNAIRRRVRDQHRGEVLGADPPHARDSSRFSLAIGRSSFVISRMTSKCDDKRPMTDGG